MDRQFTPQTYARAIGALLLVTMVAGIFGELYAPSQIIAADAAATAKNLRESEWLFRAGFAGYLIEALCDVTLSYLFYGLLKPVHRDLSLMAAFFGLVSTSLFGAAELFYFTSHLAVAGKPYLDAFSVDQQQAMAMHSLKIYGLGGGIFMVFYGSAMLIRGYLVYKSGFLPKALGSLLMLAGTGFITKNFLLILAPAYSSPYLLLPMFVSIISLALWLLIRGVSPRAAHPLREATASS